MIDKSFLRAGHLPTLAAAFFYFDMSFMVWVMLGPLGVAVAGDLKLDAAQKGLMVAVPLLMQFYREHAKYKERTYTFVERLGIERIRAVVDDSEGIAAELDAAMQASVDATYDPWTEAAAPKTANQFSSLIAADGG
jgi:hypothetical protein